MSLELEIRKQQNFIHSFDSGKLLQGRDRSLGIIWQQRSSSIASKMSSLLIETLLFSIYLIINKAVLNKYLE